MDPVGGLSLLSCGYLFLHYWSKTDSGSNFLGSLFYCCFDLAGSTSSSRSRRTLTREEIGTLRDTAKRRFDRIMSGTALVACVVSVVMYVWVDNNNAQEYFAFNG